MKDQINKAIHEPIRSPIKKGLIITYDKDIS